MHSHVRDGSRHRLSGRRFRSTYLPEILQHLPSLRPHSLPYRNPHRRQYGKRATCHHTAPQRPETHAHRYNAANLFICFPFSKQLTVHVTFRYDRIA